MFSLGGLVACEGFAWDRAFGSNKTSFLRGRIEGTSPRVHLYMRVVGILLQV